MHEALRNSQRLIFEITPDPKSDFPNKFEIAATYSQGDDIRHHVHAKTWEFLANDGVHVESMGVQEQERHPSLMGYFQPESKLIRIRNGVSLKTGQYVLILARIGFYIPAIGLWILKSGRQQSICERSVR